MAAFALAASATLGPVNIIGAMTGAHHGALRALPFVRGTTTGFLAVFILCGAVMLAAASGLRRWPC